MPHRNILHDMNGSLRPLVGQVCLRTSDAVLSPRSVLSPYFSNAALRPNNREVP